MERLLDKRNGKVDAFSDPSNRIPKRPLAVKVGEGVGFQDIGSSLSPPNAPTCARTYKARFKSAKNLPPITRKKPPRISEDESDDELLLSSQTSTGDVTSPSRRVAKGKKTEITSDDEETIYVNGRRLKAHPDFKPSSSDTLKGLRFTKNKKNAPAGDVETSLPPPSSSLTDSQDLFEPISRDVEILDGPPMHSSSSRQKPPGTRRRSPSVTHTIAHLLPDAKNSITPKAPSSTDNDISRSFMKPRPRPRVIIKPTAHKPGNSPESTPRPAARPFPLRSRTPERPTSAERKQTIKKLTFPVPSRREPQEFPMSLQAKENVSDGARSSDGSSSKAKKCSLMRSATFAHTPKPIPLPSPLRMKPVSRGTTFPNLSPLSSPVDKGKARAKFPDEDDFLRGRAGPKPFPMSSQMLAGIDRRLKSPSLRSTKRASSDDGSDERGRSAKKRRDSRLGILDPLDYLNEPMEDDSIDIGHARDPSTLCPYCDEQLPSHPTPFLKHLLVTARKKSFSDPRPRNRGGLRAPLTIYISVCQRHRFESHQLPIAAERGWPKTIDFTKVPDRVKKMKKELEAIIFDKDHISDVEDLGTDDRPRGPRSESVFWREIKKEMKKRGSRTVVGVKGQYASFEKTQPGYYGEQGSVIIHQTLFDLFPPSMFDASLISPLAPAEFIQRVLVPEVAVRLIAQDLCVDIDEAIVILRDSAQYGVAMFPDTGENKRKGGSGDDDEMDVADRIVMERARVRRKELAEEEKVEKEMLEAEQAAQCEKARASRREKAIERAQLAKQNKVRAEGKVDTEDAGGASEASATRGRRGPRQRAAADDSESDAMSVDSLANRRSARITKKVGQGDGGKTARTVPQPKGSDSDSLEVVDDSKRKTIIRTGKTKEPTRGANLEITALRDRAKPFGGFTVLDSDGEQGSTPRPTRQRTTETDAAGNATHSLQARMLPLQMARNRSGARAPTTHDGWSRNLRTGAPDDADSDASNASRRSQRLVRAPIKRRGLHSWLLSDPSSSDSP